jgi:type I restriction enzyme S subunit
MSFKEVQLQDVLDIQWGDTKTTKASYVPNGFLAYSATGPDGFLENYAYDRDGVVLSAIGANCGSTFYATGKWSCIKNTIRIFPRNPSIDLKYFFYMTKAPDFFPLRGSAQPFISQTDIRELYVKIPELRVQKAIGKLLYELEKKIEVNAACAKTLEDIAQTIFKSWFIDFDPVKAKMAGEKPAGMDAATAALFPDSMVESELGLIPKGWEVTALGDICATTIGGLWGNDEKSLENSDSYQCIRGVDMDDLKALGYAPRVPIRWDKLHNFSKRLLSGTQILIAGSGAGPVAKSLLWDESMNILFSKPVVFSNFVKRFECNSNEMASFVSSILTTMYESREIFTFVNGTSVPNLQDRELLIGKKVAVPSIDLLRAYDSIKRTSIKRKYSGENSNLVAIRDSLLPRLISGELQIPTEILSS